MNSFEVLGIGDRTDDEWEQYIRDASVEGTIIERGVRWAEFQKACETKQGGSTFSLFAEERFQYDNSTASHWATIGHNADELRSIATNFSPDWTAFYAYTGLTDDQKQRLLEGPDKISRKTIKAVKESRSETRKIKALQWDGSTRERFTIYNLDFREMEIEENSVDLIFTDPPYDAATIPLYEDMAIQAARVLKPGGSLITYAGHYAIPEIMALMGPHLRYWWIICLKHGGNNARLIGKNVFVHWKPLLWFVKDRRLNNEFVADYFESSQPTKNDHDWQQDVSEARYYINRLTVENGLVYDPFCGSGTTGVAALQTGCRFIGSEIDDTHWAISNKRLNDVIDGIQD